MTKRSLRVLLIDDNEDSCELFQMALEMEGHRVEASHDGAAGYRMLVAGSFDLAMVDIGLPGMDGYEIARAAHAALGERTPKLVAVTGYGNAADKEAASQAGFAAHLVKPANVSKLLATIASVIEG